MLEASLESPGTLDSDNVRCHFWVLPGGGERTGRLVPHSCFFYGSSCSLWGPPHEKEWGTKLPAPPPGRTQVPCILHPPLGAAPVAGAPQAPPWLHLCKTLPMATVRIGFPLPQRTSHPTGGQRGFATIPDHEVPMELPRSGAVYRCSHGPGAGGFSPGRTPSAGHQAAELRRGSPCTEQPRSESGGVASESPGPGRQPQRDPPPAPRGGALTCHPPHRLSLRLRSPHAPQPPPQPLCLSISC